MGIRFTTDIIIILWLQRQCASSPRANQPLVTWLNVIWGCYDVMLFYLCYLCYDFTRLACLERVIQPSRQNLPQDFQVIPNPSYHHLFHNVVCLQPWSLGATLDLQTHTDWSDCQDIALSFLSLFIMLICWSLDRRVKLLLIKACFKAFHFCYLRGCDRMLTLSLVY